MPRHLRNTLVLPETDARLAAAMLSSAINALDVLLMLVFGKSAEAAQIVEWADQLCDKTRISDSLNARQVVWIRDATSQSLRAVLDPLLGPGPLPRVATLNFHDQIRDVIPGGQSIAPLDLELMFLEAGLIENSE